MERSTLQRLLERSERPVFLLLLLAHLFVVWHMPVFLTQDGPSHLYNARILLELWSGDHTGLYAKFFSLNNTFSPNWTGNILLAGFLKFLSPIAAEKAIVSLYMIALPMAFRHAVRTLGGATPYLSSLIFLLTYNYHLVYGFFNFCLGLAVLFWFVAALHRFMEQPTWKRGMGCALLLLLMLATHPVALLLGFVLLGCRTLQYLITSWKRGDRGPLAWRPVATTVALAGPALLLFLLFMPASTPDQPPLFENKWSGETVCALLRMDQLIVFGGNEGSLFRTVALLFAALLGFALWKNRKVSATTTGALLLALMTCCLSIHFFLTDQLAGGAYLTSRMALIAWVVFALYIATRPLPLQAVAGGVIGAALLSFSLLVIRYPMHARCGELAEAYIAECAAIPDGSTFLPLCFSDRGEFGNEKLSPRISVFKHISGYVAAERPVISLDNYEANTTYFQTAWLPTVNPFTQLCASGDCNIEGQPTTADIPDYEERAQRSIDFVVLWGDQLRAARQPGYREFMSDLTQRFEPLTATRDGNYRLYGRKKTTP
ncbi:MAG: hypothetical protein ABI599_04160 [Flavobacteriales bacterium]